MKNTMAHYDPTTHYGQFNDRRDSVIGFHGEDDTSDESLEASLDSQVPIDTEGANEFIDGNEERSIADMSLKAVVQLSPLSQAQKIARHLSTTAEQRRPAITSLESQLASFKSNSDDSSNRAEATPTAQDLVKPDPLPKKRKLSQLQETQQHPAAADIIDLTEEVEIPVKKTRNHFRCPRAGCRKGYKTQKKFEKHLKQRSHQEPSQERLRKQQHIDEVMAGLRTCGQPFEDRLSGTVQRATTVLQDRKDANAVIEPLLGMEKEWKLSNRQHLQQMVKLLQHHGIVGIGGVEVPDRDLDVPPLPAEPAQEVRMECQ